MPQVDTDPRMGKNWVIKLNQSEYLFIYPKDHLLDFTLVFLRRNRVWNCVPCVLHVLLCVHQHEGRHKKTLGAKCILCVQREFRGNRRDTECGTVWTRTEIWRWGCFQEVKRFNVTEEYSLLLKSNMVDVCPVTTSPSYIIQWNASSC